MNSFWRHAKVYSLTETINLDEYRENIAYTNEIFLTKNCNLISKFGSSECNNFSYEADIFIFVRFYSKCIQNVKLECISSIIHLALFFQ